MRRATRYWCGAIPKVWVKLLTRWAGEAPMPTRPGRGWSARTRPSSRSRRSWASRPGGGPPASGGRPGGLAAVPRRWPARLGRQRVVGLVQGPVEGVDGAAQGGIVDVRPVHRRAGQPLVEDLGAQVQDAFAEPAATGGAAVVDDVGGQDGDGFAAGPAGPRVQVVTDPAVVDDEHRPGVVHVRRVGVVDEAGVEDLVDARDRRLPGPDPFGPGRLPQRQRHASIVQDGPLPPSSTGAMNELLGWPASRWPG